MAEAFTQQQEEPQSTQLSFEERFALLVDRQWDWRQNLALERRLREGRLRGPACVEDIDFRAAGGLDKQVIRPLLQSPGAKRRVLGNAVRTNAVHPGRRNPYANAFATFLFCRRSTDVQFAGQKRQGRAAGSASATRRLRDSDSQYHECIGRKFDFRIIPRNIV